MYRAASTRMRASADDGALGLHWPASRGDLHGHWKPSAASSGNRNCRRHAGRSGDAAARRPANDDDFSWGRRITAALRRSQDENDLSSSADDRLSAVLAGGLATLLRCIQIQARQPPSNAPATATTNRSLATAAPTIQASATNTRRRSRRIARTTRPHNSCAGPRQSARYVSRTELLLTPNRSVAAKTTVRCKMKQSTAPFPFTRATWSGLPPPSASPVRHRDPNAAVIGGAASPNRRSTASLNGTRMNARKPRN